MNLVFFIHQDSLKKGETLKGIIEKRFNDINSRILHTFKMLKSRLKKSSGSTEKEIFVLLAESKNRLDELTSLIDLLENKRVILILPDESKETISKASQFFPRFFTLVSETYDDLLSVLNKMINQNNTNTKHYNKGENKNARIY
ncbi:MAG: hypothetical protein KAR45_00555 [Desulfobacteraceae bacterium]|nr:hypothetical protein [Desulfobacteraceae bacterium]